MTNALSRNATATSRVVLVISPPERSQQERNRDGCRKDAPEEVRAVSVDEALLLGWIDLLHGSPGRGRPEDRPLDRMSVGGNHPVRRRVATLLVGWPQRRADDLVDGGDARRPPPWCRRERRTATYAGLPMFSLNVNEIDVGKVARDDPSSGSEPTSDACAEAGPAPRARHSRARRLTRRTTLGTSSILSQCHNHRRRGHRQRSPAEPAGRVVSIVGVAAHALVRRGRIARWCSETQRRGGMLRFGVTGRDHHPS